MVPHGDGAVRRLQLGLDDTEVLRSAVNELSTRTYQMTESLYAQLGGDAGE